MSSTTAPNFPLFYAPYLVRKIILQQMSPEALVSFNQISSTTRRLLPALMANVSIQYSIEDPYFLVKGSNGEEAFIPMEYYEDVHRVYCLTELADIEIEFDEHSRPEDYKLLLKTMDRLGYMFCNTLRIYSRNNDILDIGVLKDVLEVLTQVRRTILDCGIVDYPYGHIISGVVDVINGDLMDENEVKKMYMCCEEARLHSSRLSDTGFNILVRDWLNGRNDSIKYLEVASGTRRTKFPFEREGIERLLKDVECVRRGPGVVAIDNGEVRFQFGWDIERNDGIRATILRSKDKLGFVVWDI